MTDTDNLDTTLLDGAPADIHLSPLSPDAVRAVKAVAATVPIGILAIGDDRVPAGEWKVLQAESEALMDAVVRLLLGGVPAPGLAEAAGRQEARLRAVVDWMDDELARRLLDAPPEHLLKLLRTVVDAAALELYHHTAALAPVPAGGMVLVARPVPPHWAYALLEERVYARAADELLGDGLFNLEARASTWCFDRWSVEAPGREEHERYARRHAWLYADRPGLRTDVPPLEQLVRDGVTEGWPPMQRRLAGALPRSVAGAFEVLEGAGERMRARSLADGRECPLLGDAAGALVPGTVVLGRILPLDDAFVASRSGVMVSRMTRADVEHMRVLFRALLRNLPPALAVEAMISRGVRGRPVPRRVLPADGMEAAWEELLRAHEVLEANGLGGPDEPGPVPHPTRREQRVQHYTFEVDETVADWMTALGEMARRWAPKRRREKGRGKKKGKRR